VPRTRSTQKFPIVVELFREKPRIRATATAMPTAALRKFWTASAPIWDRYDMVVSPEYACQFVLVTNDTAVFQAKAGVTPGRCCGLNGKWPCNRKIRYEAPMATPEKTIIEAAYRCHGCSASGSMPISR
jgi:hypothetical protein